MEIWEKKTEILKSLKSVFHEMQTDIHFVANRAAHLLAIVARFLMILEILDFCQKFGFWAFLEITGDSGMVKIQFVLIFGRTIMAPNRIS